MNRKSRSILIAMAIGDGYIHKDRRLKKQMSMPLVIAHSPKQEEYIRYKANLVHSMLGGKNPTIRSRTYTLSNGKTYPGLFFEKSHPYFRVLRKWMYINDKKFITSRILQFLSPEAIAIWYMDDGSCVVNCRSRKGTGEISSVRCNIHTCCTLGEAETVCNYFKNTYSIKFTTFKEKGNYSIRCFTKEARKFRDLITEYMIPSMRYKFQYLNEHERMAPLK